MLSNRLIGANKGSAGDPYWSNVSLLLKGDGVNGGTSFPDSSSTNSIPTVTPTMTTSTAQVKWGTASILGGASGYISYPHHANQLIGTGQFTIEGWVYITGTVAIIFNKNWTTGIMLYHNNSGNFDLLINGVSITSAIAGGTINSWRHFAVQRDVSNFLSVYYNGIRTYNVVNTANISSTAPLLICRDNGTSGYVGSYLDDFRFTIGVARYSGASITVPSAAFTTF